MKRPSGASLLIAVAAVFFAFGHVAAGSSGPTLHLQTAAGNIRHVYAGGAVLSTATCPKGELTVSGGWAPVSESTDELGLYISRPTAHLSEWQAFVFDKTPQGEGDGNATVEAYAICASVNP